MKPGNQQFEVIKVHVEMEKNKWCAFFYLDRYRAITILVQELFDTREQAQAWATDITKKGWLNVNDYLKYK